MTKTQQEPIAPPVAFEEFKLYFESIERVTDRRLDLTKTNSQLATLIIAGIGAALSWSDGAKDTYALPITLLGTTVICALSMLFCEWWRRQITSYKDLNGAKFTVLNEMACHLSFPTSPQSTIRSARPFAREWDILERQGNLQKYKVTKALDASLSEVMVPLAFALCFLLIGMAALILILTRFPLHLN